MKFRIYLFIKIETYWNVNTLATTENYLALDIKIETYWNVNQPAPSQQHCNCYDLNRDILECKYRKSGD